MFRFKQFTIKQEHCPMKVSTDSVLLGSWARVSPDDRQILDIGTGTGVVALMLAQRSNARVTGVDIGDVDPARANAEASPWRTRMEMVQCPVQEYVGGPFELIVSNPPYFVDSLTCPDQGRTLARHTTQLSFTDLHDAVVRLLTPEGRFCVILPATESLLFMQACTRLFLARRLDVQSTPQRGVRRVLMELTLSPQPAYMTNLMTIRTAGHEEYTEQYRALTRDFYLKF